MDVSFIVSMGLFLLFISLILVSAINYFLRTPELSEILELRTQTKNLFDLFFGSGGIETAERATTNLHRIPLLIEENNGTARTNEVVEAAIEFDEACNKKTSWNTTVRVYDQQFNELPLRISYQEFCEDQWLNTSIITFQVNMSANEKKRVYVYSINNSNTTPPSHNLTIQGYWTFDERGGTLAKDFSGNGNNGTLNNFDFNATSGWHNGTDCQRVSCLRFDGTNDFVSMSDSAAVRFDSGSQDFSLSAWIQRNQTGAEHYIINKLDADNDGWALSLTSSNTVVCSVDSTDVTSSSTITNTNWHHVACVIDRDGNGQVYIDGIADGDAVSIGGEAMATTSQVYIGARSYTTTSYFRGAIDDARVYNRTLTTGEIESLANSTRLAVTSFPAENITAVSATKLQDLTVRNYEEIKAALGGDFDFRIEIRGQ